MNTSNASLYSLVRAALFEANVTGEGVNVYIDRRIVAFTWPRGLVGIGFQATDAERAEIKADWFHQHAAYCAMMAA